jgi:hypothetical protein
MNIPAATAKTPTELARDAMYTAEASATICKLCNAIITLDARLSSIETYLEKHTPFRELSDPADPGLSHPCGCEPTTARYPCDPISAPRQDHEVAEELWACLKFIKANLNEYTDFNAIHKLAWSEVQRRAKALFPNRTL